jgi:hypothetical protein
LLNDFLWQYFVSHYLSPHHILWVHLFRIYSLPDKVFGQRYQSPPFNNVLFVHLIQGGSFYPCQKHYLKANMN